MRIHEFAKELTKETGKPITSSQVLMLLSKKQEGLRITSNISDEMMEYVRVRLTGKKSEKAIAAQKKAVDEDMKKKAAAKKAADEKKAAAKKAAAEKKKQDEVKKLYEAKKKAEAKRIAEAKKAEEEAKRLAEEKEAEKKRQEEEKRLAEEKAAKEAAEKAAAEAAAEAEAAKKAAEEKKAEEKKAEEASEKAEEKKEEKAPEKKPAKAPKTEAASKPERAPRADKSERSDRSDRGDRGDKSDRGDRADKGDRKPRKGAQKTVAMDDDIPSKKSSSRRKDDKSRDRQREAREEERDRRDGKNSSHSKRRDNKRVNPEREQERIKKKQQPKPKQEKKEEDTIKTVILPETLTLSELADKLKTPVNAMIKKLFLEGKMYTVNTDITYEEAENIALEYNFIAEQEVKVDIVEEALKDIEDPEDSLTSRPPVVCVMGHVDHGKTSLLDAIRKTSVTEGEAGGITQHIGAYTVKVDDKKITFLDTPGHEAFTAMRLRGALATDIAILVVAADDGVMPQTVEAINHAKAAGIQIIVAVNKIDKPSANIERVKQELVEYGLVSEDWGGDTIFCPVSAKSHEGIDNLLDMILLTSDILELKANAKRKARGVVIEARLDKGRGPVSTLLVQKGTLKTGDFIAIGESHGRVRAMTDDKQRQVKEATPSMPVEVIGLDSVPNSGEIFIATDTEKEARSISEAFVTKGKENLIAETKAKMSLDDIFSKMQEGTLKELNIIIKADVQGSVEALKQSLLKLSNDEIIIKAIHSGVGAINESDVSLAAASGAIIVGFNIRPEPLAKQLADQEKVDVRLYRVIYNAIDDIESAMKGMLDPIFEEKVIGHAEVRQTFKASGIGVIAGSFVLDGSIERNASARISRGGELVWEGKIASLKRFKDDAKEVKAGYECGIVFDDFNDVHEGDTVEVYKMVEKPRD